MQETRLSGFEYEVEEENGERYVTITEYIGHKTEVVIPEMLDGLPVRTIGDGAFSRYKGLTSITLPKRLTTIGRRAFYGCTGLTSITLPEGVKENGDDNFEGVDNLTIHAPTGSMAEQYAKEMGIPFQGIEVV